MVATAWLFLIVAGLFEPCWAISLKNSNGLRKFKWTVATFAFMAMSVFLMSRALVSLPAGTTYAVWTGIGAICTLTAGVVLFKEQATALRMLFAVLIISGIVGLEMFTVV